jgi:hypothetical protein
MEKSKLKQGAVIISLEDIIIPGTGCTFYIWKGKRYTLKQYLAEWREPAWNIQLEETILNNRKNRRNSNYSFSDQGWFTEVELFQKFNCLQYLRKEKLQKLNSL